MGTISKNFSYREFEASDTADRHRLINNIVSFEVRDSIKALVDNVLQPLRDAWGEPLSINSGYRSSEVNALCGGVSTSQHTKGEAADIKADHPLALAKVAIDHKLPFDQLIIYPTFVHFSHKLNGKQRGQILYNKAWKGEKPW